jgi:hypothetical protein
VLYYNILYDTIFRTLSSSTMPLKDQFGKK